MYNDKIRKIITMFLVFTIITLLSSCGYTLSRDVTSQEALERAVREGLLSPIEEVDGDERARTLVEVKYGQVLSETNIVLQLDMSQVRPLFFERREVRLLEIFVSLDEVVEEGDVLAIASFDTRELEEEIEILYLAIQRRERALRLGLEQHQEILNDMRDALDLMETDYERLSQSHRISRQELLMGGFISQYEERLEAYNEELTYLYELIEGDKIIAPFDGIITWVTEEDVDSVIRNDEYILGIIDPSRFQLSFAGGIELIRYGDVLPVRLHDYDLEFYVEVISDPIAARTREDVHNFVLQPIDRQWLWNSIYELEINFSRLRSLRFESVVIAYYVNDVLVVPREAPFVLDDQHYVLLYEDGEVRVRFIDMGLRDREYAQILSGLEAGQLVVR